MQLGFVSAILPDFTLEEVFAAAAEYDFDCVELMCWPTGKAERRYAGVTHIDAVGFDEDEAARVHEVAARYGISISGLGYYPNPLTPDLDESAHSVEHIQAVILAARVLGVQQVNTFVGRDWTRSVDDNWPRFMETWPPIVQFAEENGVRIGIENCPMFFTADEWPGGKNMATTPVIWRRMFDAIPSQSFGLNYDPSHMVWQQMDYLRPIQEFADRIFHVHAKDVRMHQDRLAEVGIMAHPLEYHSPKVPGRGTIHWNEFCDALVAIDYDGAVCVEVEDRDFEGSIADRRDSLRFTGDFLRQFAPFRRKD